MTTAKQNKKYQNMMVGKVKKEVSVKMTATIKEHRRKEQGIGRVYNRRKKRKEDNLKKGQEAPNRQNGESGSVSKKVAEQFNEVGGKNYHQPKTDQQAVFRNEFGIYFGGYRLSDFQ